ncbi:hypothetical protein FB451DRAFT_1416915 [Mycena latifolia]|nr:hypothetical protein FB451DRAFT_1416915 [Mycena latifolia]
MAPIPLPDTAFHGGALILLILPEAVYMLPYPYAAFLPSLPAAARTHVLSHVTIAISSQRIANTSPGAQALLLDILEPKKQPLCPGAHLLHTTYVHEFHTTRTSGTRALWHSSRSTGALRACGSPAPQRCHYFVGDWWARYCPLAHRAPPLFVAAMALRPCRALCWSHLFALFPLTPFLPRVKNFSEVALLALLGATPAHALVLSALHGSRVLFLAHVDSELGWSCLPLGGLGSIFHAFFGPTTDLLQIYRGLVVDFVLVHERLCNAYPA